MAPRSLHPVRCAGAALLALLAISSCRAPDPKALQKLACEQAAANLDLQSLSQMDALRKALGVAPDVDPISACKALGARMDPTAPAEPAEAEQTEGQR
jgi:hypothetical protein